MLINVEEHRRKCLLIESSHSDSAVIVRWRMARPDESIFHTIVDNLRQRVK
jgi:hypothetical protein